MHTRVIGAILKKDVHGLLPMILLAFVVFFIQPVIAGMDLDSASDFWITLQGNFYWLGYGIALLLLISVLQLDPADSLNHDWLTRPVTRTDWLMAKLLFLLVTIYAPVVLARLVLNLGNDYGLLRTLGYALTIENPAALLPVPLIFSVALMTPTLRRFLLVSVLIFMVFLGPAWDVSRPLFDLLGIDLGTDYDGLMWLQALPLVVWGCAAAGLIYWLRYARRQSGRAWLVLGCCVALYFLTVFTPPSLYGWDQAIAIHRAFLNRDLPDENVLDEAVSLKHDSACFAAARLDSLASDPVLSQAGLYEDIVERAGPGALVFATPVSNREILVDWFAADAAGQEVPVAWAVDRIRVQGRFSADSLEQDVALIPANRSLNRYDPVSAADTHYWLIPGTAVEALANDPTTRLTLDFDLGLLDPDAYRLPTDGQRHEIPELGSCRAETDLNANQIEIDCVKNGTQPALVAAQLIGIDSSRVYSRFRPTYKADWLETLSRKHYRMTIDSPTLTDSSAIMLTAFNARRIVHRQLVTQGLFGDLPAVCPLQESETHDAIEQSTWSDKSPHEISSVAVEQGVRLEVLDWRQHNPADAPTLVLLHGLGATAHSFDELAPRLAEKYNVVAITRRGIGGSSAPDHGYDIARLSQDVLQVLATLQIEQPVLVGHSIAGEELSYLGARFPERFAGLVYLDAAYDRTAGFSHHYRELSVSLPEAPPIRPAETRSYAAFLDYSRRLGRARTIPEGEILASYDLVSGSIRHNPLYLDAVMMGLQAPDYRHITIPALGIYAVPVSPEALMEPWYDQDDPEVKAAVTELYTMERQQKLAQMARFDSEIPDSKALALDNANHWIFVSHEAEVLAAIDRFMSGLMP